ncbi:MAG TPA: zf-HC2 domain-containing protein [Streptosporangiaceae bacterium]
MMPPAHVEVAAFVLGVLDEEEMELFENHLQECTACQAELRQLYHLPGLLDEVRQARPAEPQPSEAVLGALLDDVAVVRGRRRRTVLLAAAAAVTLLAAAPPATRWLWPSSPAHSAAAAPTSHSPTGTEVLQASNKVNAVSAKAVIQPKGWGTLVDIELSGIRGPLQCELVVVTHSGKSEVMTSWQVPNKAGYGVPGAPAPLFIEAGTSYFRGDIARFEVRTTTGPHLVDVPA